MTAPPIQAGHAKVRTVTTAQNHGQNPRGPRSFVAAKKERPVQTLYLMHSYTSAVSRTTEIVISQCMCSVPRAEMFGSRYASPPPIEIPKLIACGPSAASIPASVSGNGFGTRLTARGGAAGPVTTVAAMAPS